MPDAPQRQGARVRALHEAGGLEGPDLVLEAAPVDGREALAAHVVRDGEANVAGEQPQALVDRDLGRRAVRGRGVADAIDDRLEPQELAAVLVAHLQEERRALLGGPAAVDLIEPLVDVAAERAQVQDDAEEHQLRPGEHEQEDEQTPVGDAEDRGAREHDDVPRVHERVLDVDPQAPLLGVHRLGARADDAHRTRLGRRAPAQVGRTGVASAPSAATCRPVGSVDLTLGLLLARHRAPPFARALE